MAGASFHIVFIGHFVLVQEAVKPDVNRLNGLLYLFQPTLREDKTYCNGSKLESIRLHLSGSCYHFLTFFSPKSRSIPGGLLRASADVNRDFPPRYPLHACYIVRIDRLHFTAASIAVIISCKAFSLNLLPINLLYLPLLII